MQKRIDKHIKKKYNKTAQEKISFYYVLCIKRRLYFLAAALAGLRLRGARRPVIILCGKLRRSEVKDG